MEERAIAAADENLRGNHLMHAFWGTLDTISRKIIQRVVIISPRSKTFPFIAALIRKPFSPSMQEKRMNRRIRKKESVIAWVETRERDTKILSSAVQTMIKARRPEKLPRARERGESSGKNCLVERRRKERKDIWQERRGILTRTKKIWDFFYPLSRPLRFWLCLPGPDRLRGH